LNEVPFLAWVAIAVVVVITLLINIAMVALLRNPTQLRNLKMPRDQRQAVDMKKAVDTLRDPFRVEREQLNELSNLLHGLESTAKGKDPGHQSLPGEVKKDE